MSYLTALLCFQVHQQLKSISLTFFLGPCIHTLSTEQKLPTFCYYIFFLPQLPYVHPPFFSAVSLPRKGQLETMLFRSLQSWSAVLSPQFLQVHFPSFAATWKAVVKCGVSDLHPTHCALQFWLQNLWKTRGEDWILYGDQTKNAFWIRLKDLLWLCCLFFSHAWVSQLELSWN